MFDLKGKIILNKDSLTEDEELKLIEAGVEDVKKEDGNIVLYTKPENLYQTQKICSEMNFSILESSLDFIPKNIEKISEDEKEIYEKLFDELDDQSEVKDIFSTIEF
jgi:transcriptional/translational regulatory protein YebC/TACO1